MLIIRPVYLIFCKHSNTYERGCTLGKQTGESLFCDVPIAKRPAWHVPREISSVRMARMEDCSAKRNKKELENDWYLCAGNFSDSNGDVVVNGAARRFARWLSEREEVRESVDQSKLRAKYFCKRLNRQSEKGSSLRKMGFRVKWMKSGRKMWKEVVGYDEVFLLETIGRDEISVKIG